MHQHYGTDDNRFHKSVLTKVVLEDEECDDVDEEGDCDGDAHEPVEGAVDGGQIQLNFNRLLSGDLQKAV